MIKEKKKIIFKPCNNQWVSVADMACNWQIL